MGLCSWKKSFSFYQIGSRSFRTLNLLKQSHWIILNTSNSTISPSLSRMDFWTFSPLAISTHTSPFFWLSSCSSHLSGCRSLSCFSMRLLFCNLRFLSRSQDGIWFVNSTESFRMKAHGNKSLARWLEIHTFKSCRQSRTKERSFRERKKVTK